MKVGDQKITDNHRETDSLAKYFCSVHRVDRGGPGAFVLDISQQFIGN